LGRQYTVGRGLTDKGYVRYNGRNLANWYPTGTQTTAKEKIAARNARYDYLYSPAEMAELLKGQLELMTKTSVLALAFNNHFRIKAIVNAIENLRLLAGEPHRADVRIGSRGAQGDEMTQRNL